MSIFSGRQRPGAMAAHRTARYRAAVGRQLLMHDRGYYIPQPTSSWLFFDRAFLPVKLTPAPVDEFCRPGDTGDSEVDNVDYRSYALPVEPVCTCDPPEGIYFHRGYCAIAVRYGTADRA